MTFSISVRFSPWLTARAESLDIKPFHGLSTFSQICISSIARQDGVKPSDVWNNVSGESGQSVRIGKRILDTFRNVQKLVSAQENFFLFGFIMTIRFSFICEEGDRFHHHAAMHGKIVVCIFLEIPSQSFLHNPTNRIVRFCNLVKTPEISSYIIREKKTDFLDRTCCI